MPLNALISLRGRLILLLLVIIGLFCAVMVYSAIDLRNKQTHETKQKALQFARSITFEQQRHIAEARHILPLMVQLQDDILAAGGKPCNQLLADLLTHYPYFANFGVIAPDGYLICSGLPMDARTWLGDRSYFRDAVDTGDFVVGDYQVGRVTKISSINFGFPFFLSPGNLSGVIYAALDLSWLRDELKRLALPDGGIITLMDRRGAILARHPQRDDLIGRTAPAWSIAERLIDENREGTAQAISLVDAQYIYSVVPLQANRNAGAYVSVAIPSKIAYAELNTLMLWDLGIMLLIASMAFAFAWLGSDRFLIKPLVALRQASERLNKGDLKTRVGSLSGTPDLDRLARTFDDMAASLEDRYNRIQRQDEELKRVNRALQTLSGGNQALMRATDDRELLQEMCRVAVQVGGYSVAWVGYAQNDKRKSVRPMAQEGIDKAFLEGLKINWSESAEGISPTGTAIRSGKPCLGNQLKRTRNDEVWDQLFYTKNIRSSVSLPLRIEGRILGAFTIYSDDAKAFDDRELMILEEMAEDMAFGIRMIRLRRKAAKAERTIHNLAYYDDITGLPNHNQLERILEDKILAAGTDQAQLALLVIGLDRFRDINSTLGFDAGNRVLSETGRRIRQMLGEAECIARMRGDEFALVLSDTDAEQAKKRAAQILDKLQQLYSLEGFALAIRASIGIVLFPDHAQEADKLIRRADVALQYAKQSGRGYSVYSRDNDKNKSYLLELSGKLHRALENDELSLYYQPKVSMTSNRVIGFEALARWFHPRDGMIPPDVFIDLAERTGMIRAVSFWVLEAAMKQSFQWRKSGLELPIAVNLSARNLHESDLIENIERLSERWRLRPNSLEIEITENAIAEDVDVAFEVLTKLKNEGFAIYVDDFGTGFSSLSTLKTHPVSAIKIDKSFVIDMLNNKDAAAIVESTIKLGHDMDLLVVAEGVENAEIYARLYSLGCDIAQGYYMSKPMKADEVTDWLRQSVWGYKEAEKSPSH